MDFLYTGTVHLELIEGAQIIDGIICGVLFF